MSFLSSSVALHRAIHELSYQENERKTERRYTVSSVHSDVTVTGKEKEKRQEKDYYTFSKAGSFSF